MNKDRFIMLENIAVLQFNLSTAKFTVIDRKHLPFLLKGKYSTPIDWYRAIMLWLNSRSLILSRRNAKIVYQMLNAPQSDTDETRAQVAMLFKAVSLLDNYWVKEVDSLETWRTVNVRHNSLNNIIPESLLHGECMSLQGSLCTPEIGTNGTYAKAWRRHADGTLWLHKADSEMEAICSNLLNKMNVEHCHYELTQDRGILVSSCPSLTNDNISIVDYLSFERYAGKDAFTKAVTIDAESIYKMFVVDYLLCNPDRHDQNWGFYYDPHSMQILKCHPLFDHNKAFSVFERNFPYYPTKLQMGMREAAKEAINRVDFHFTSEITREDFVQEDHYREFMERASELSII